MSVVIDGNLGITTPAETVQGALTTTGNTILGDASTDTLNVGNGGLVKDASGNVGIGTASPVYKLDVVGSTNGNIVGRILNQNAGSSTQAIFQISTGTSGTAYANMNVNYTGQYFQNAGVGLTSSYHDYDTQIYRNNAGTERMRIDTSGNLLVGTTSLIYSTTAPSFQIATAGVTPLVIRNTSTTAGKYWRTGPDTSNSYVVSNQGGAGVYITDGATSWSGYSDENLKTDLKPIENAASKVSTLRAVTGRFKTDDNGVSRAFLIAQDVQAVLPEAVSEAPDGFLGLAYSDVIPLLTAAIQEQQALITQLQADVATLKALSA